MTLFELTEMEMRLLIDWNDPKVPLNKVKKAATLARAKRVLKAALPKEQKGKTK